MDWSAISRIIQLPLLCAVEGRLWETAQDFVRPIFGSIGLELAQPHVLVCTTILAILFSRFLGRASLLKGLLFTSLFLCLTPLSVTPILRISDALGPQYGASLLMILLFAPAMSFGAAYTLHQLSSSRNVIDSGADRRYMFTGASCKVSLYRRTSSSSSLEIEVLQPAQCGLLLLAVSRLSHPSLPKKASKIVRRSNQRWKKVYDALYLAAGAIAALCQANFTGRLLQSSPETVVLATFQGRYSRISVIEHKLGSQYLRAMTADHSLLGGIWIEHARRKVAHQGHTSNPFDLEQKAVDVAESIFTTFYLQEAVLLTEPQRSSQDTKVLNIGLGIGIAAKAFIQRGFEVSICEIEPKIYDFARQYFGLPDATGQLYIEDARSAIQKMPASYYTHIIHDVFTGGAVPSSLFTTEFWQQTRRVMAPDGVLAVNFAGKIKSAAGQLVLHTLIQAFPVCRAFVDGAGNAENHTNMVVFCSLRDRLDFTAYSAYGPAEMRHATLANFEKQEITLPKSSTADLALHDNNSTVLDEAQQSAALEHWHLMRKQMSYKFWAAPLLQQTKERKMYSAINA